MKTWLDQQVHAAFVQLKARWAELLLNVVGIYLLLLGLASPFITVVPHGTPGQMKRERFWSTIAFILVGVALASCGAWLARRRRRLERTVQPQPPRPGVDQ